MQENKDTGRIETFSDSIFAIAATLLVLSIKVPSHESVANLGLAHSLVALWPAYLAFFSSFVTVFVIWVQHHGIFSHVQKVEHTLLYWNGLLLLVVTLVPFPTGLLAEHLSHIDAKMAAHMYTGNLLVIAMIFQGLWRHVSKTTGSIQSGSISLKHDETARITRHYRITSLLYLVAFGLTFISEIAGIATCIVLAFYSAHQTWPLQEK